MQASTKSLVVLGVLASLWSIGCSSKPAGGQPSVGTPSTTESVDAVATSLEPSDDNLVTSEVGGGKKPDAPVASKATPPIIGQFKSRHHTILIHIGSDGPRFSVATLDGKVIAEALSVDEMQAQHPEIYKTYKESFANYEGYLDASSSLIAPFGGAPASR